MPNIILKNDQLQIAIAAKGAEIQSIQSADGTEYIWQADPAFWNRHSPVLFPIVGKLKDDQYTVGGETYHLSQHGFARDLEFTVAVQTENQVTFALKANEETLEKYPFRFLLEIQYVLEGNKLEVGYRVKNEGDDKMYFAIGAHPGFNVPLTDGNDFSDYVIEITPQKGRKQIPVSKEVLLKLQEAKVNEATEISLSRELFAEGVLIFETTGETQVSLSSKKENHKVTFEYSDMPYLGIWSPYPAEAPFVCIEPWCGVADTVDTDGSLEKKLGINQLSGQGEFESGYAMIFA